MFLFALNFPEFSCMITNPCCVCIIYVSMNYIPAGNYIIKVKNRITRTRCEICSKLKIKTVEHISHSDSVSIVNFEQVNAGWVATKIRLLLS